MSDINRVFVHIDAYIESGGGTHLDVLSKVIRGSIEGAKRGYVDRDMEDEVFVTKINDADDVLKKLGEISDPGTDLNDLKRQFREAAITAMECRRLVLPLTHPEKPWVTINARESLFDDEDQYAFAIYDTLADEVAKLLPELEQIACECAWESDESVEP